MWDFEGIAKEIFRLLKDGGICVWIVGDAVINGSESGTSFRQALYFKDLGLNIHDTMIYAKNAMPFPESNRYNQRFEYMFVLSKGAKKSANLICDRKNKWAGIPIHGTERQANGNIKSRSAKQKSKSVKEYGSRFNIWDIAPEKNNKTNHPAVFPEQLANDHILSWSNEGDSVLDPFMGSGTTGVACLNTNRNFIGIELDDEYFEIAQKRIAENKAQMRF